MVQRFVSWGTAARDLVWRFERSWFALLVAGLVVVPAAASAQTVIVGVVKDTSGGVLPGVSVEARSPALIEGAKTVFTNERGEYRVIDLRPGNYRVTASLQGFATIVREGITLTADFTATVDIQMRVGSLEDSVTVSAAAPLVDVESTRRNALMTRDIVDTIPTARGFRNEGLTIPAVTGIVDVGGQNNNKSSSLFVMVYDVGEAQTLVDGIPVTQSNGSAHMYMNSNDMEEFSYTINGGNAEQVWAGFQTSLIPKSGGNTFSGAGGIFWANPSLAASNASSAQLAAGLAAPPHLARLYDDFLGIGGPIRRDRLWFYASGRLSSIDQATSTILDATDVRLRPELGSIGQAAVNYSPTNSIEARLTGQITPKNKLVLTYYREPRSQMWSGTSIENGSRPAATAFLNYPNSYWAQAKWTSTVTNKILLEAGIAPTVRAGASPIPSGLRTPEGLPPYGDIAKLEVTIPSNYNAPATIGAQTWSRRSYVGSVTYATGAHAFKTGVQLSDASTFAPYASPNGGLVQEYNNGVPFAVLIYNTPVSALDKTWEAGGFVQDTWKIKRLTLSPGVRWDKFVGSTPAQSVGAGFPGIGLPARSFPAVTNIPNWTTVSPRIGASYALFGTTTALKGSFGDYPGNLLGTLFVDQYNPMFLQTDQRTWTDRNGDGIAEANEIGPSLNPNFGLARLRAPAPDLKRPVDRMYNLTLEHQLGQGLAASVEYNRHQYLNATWANNLAVPSTAYTMFTVPDPRGNGQSVPVYQPNYLAVANIQDQNSTTNTSVYQGVNATLTWRVKSGAFVNGGLSSGRTVANTCQYANPNWVGVTGPGGPPGLSQAFFLSAATVQTGARFCDQSQYNIALRNTFKLTGSYPLPWQGLRVSAVFQSLPGNERITTYVVTRAILPQLTTLTSATERLSEPGSDYYPQVNMLDLTVGASHSFGKLRVRPELAVFNVFNANTLLSAVTAFGPRLATPLTIVPGRLARIGLQVDF